MVSRVIFNWVFCLLNKHEPKRSSTHWDGASYVGKCRGCGNRIRRVSRGNWKVDRDTR
jgi:hypothetical protein